MLSNLFESIPTAEESILESFWKKSKIDQNQKP